MIRKVKSKKNDFVADTLSSTRYLLDTVRSPYGNYYLCSFSRNTDGIRTVWAHSSGRFRKYNPKRYIFQ